MNLAEQLEARGEARGAEKEREKMAISLLKEKADPHFIARISGLELAIVYKLKAQLEDKL